MGKIKVGITGMGMIGKLHWEALRRIPDVEIVAVCTGGDDAETIARQYNIPQAYRDFGALIASSGIDALHNCTPNALHDPINQAAIDADIHIYAEKPLSGSAADALSIWKQAQRKGIVHALNHQYRMYPAVQEMRTRIAQGDMGRIFLVSGHYRQQSGLYPTDYNWRMTEGGLTCGLSDIGTHWVDTARCTTGLRIEKVFANVQTIHTQRTKPDGQVVDVCTDDLSCVLLSFEGGAQGVLTVSKVSAGHQNDLVLDVDGQAFSFHWAQEEANRIVTGYKHAPNQALQVAPLLVAPENRDLTLLPGGHPLGFNDALYLSSREFYDVLQGKKAQSAMRCATFEDGFEGMAFVDAALE